MRSACLGASPSVIGPYFLRDGFFADADYCLIDTCVVDFSVLQNETTDYYQIVKWIEWLGHKVRLSGCQPIFILIPLQHLALSNPPILRIYRSIINAFGYLFLDVRDVLAGLIEGGRIRIEDLYKDPAHMGPELCQEVAEVLGRFFSAADPFLYRRMEVTCAIKEFEVINVGDVCASPQSSRVERSNSFLQFSGLVVEQDSVFIAEVDRVRQLHAVMVNAAKSNARLAIMGDVRVVKSFNLIPYSPVDFEARLIPIRSPLQDQRGTIGFSMAGTDEPCSETTMQESAAVDSEGRCVEVSDLVLERDTKVVSYWCAAVGIGDGNLIRPGKKVVFGANLAGLICWRANTRTYIKDKAQLMTKLLPSQVVEANVGDILRTNDCEFEADHVRLVRVSLNGKPLDSPVCFIYRPHWEQVSFG
jgi:hypothetical protein